MNAPIAERHLAAVSLEDKYTQTHGRVFLTGTQALVRLPMLQRARDRAAGLNTAAYITGYRGSPLGSYDQALERARKHLDAHQIRFQPAVNEDIAATALWGTQQLNLIEPSPYDGVFGIWYGKGPGVDRCGDVFRHANACGTSPHGGVLALAGDDHGAKSSTQSAQSDFIFQAVGIPILAPSTVQEILDFGLHGFAMSRFAGVWVAIKCVTDVVESAATVDIDPARVRVHLPGDFAMPSGGLNIRWPEITGFIEQEQRLYHDKLRAVLAYARTNRLDQALWCESAGAAPEGARLGIVATGKAWGDLRQALDDLGIDEATGRRIGLRLYKVAMPWPLEPHGITGFCRGLREVVVIEEKRALVETQLKDHLYHLSDSERPLVNGKFLAGDSIRIQPSGGELSPGQVARLIAERLKPYYESDRIKARLAALDREDALALRGAGEVARIPYFCAGCPHNTSTQVPEGSRALAGIGCHYMAQWMDRRTATFSHMGGEGAAWLGQAPFSATPHVFANIGDGTYFHSGIMAIRAAAAVNLRITYKILFNDAVAMTGGQSVDGPLDVPQITRQVAAEGVARVAVVSDEPDKYPSDCNFAPGVTIHHRDDLDAVQRELREYSGTSVLVYDQTCAAEKRRRRKRGTFADPDRRVVINEAVCEGCGDCGVQSNCVAIEPLETDLGRKRQINQSACNKDESCVKGFCPSFVTVEGARLRKPLALSSDESPTHQAAQLLSKQSPAHSGAVQETQSAALSSAQPTQSEQSGSRSASQAADRLAARVAGLPRPDLPALDAAYGVIVTGIGGTGVITIGQIIGMAAHLEGKGASVLDVAGMAQKNGAVMSFVRIGTHQDDLHASRVATAGADAIIGCDAVTTAGAECLSKMEPGRTRAVVNRAQTPTAAFTHQADWQFPQASIEARLAEAIGRRDHLWLVDAQRIATVLLGDAIATNMFMLGYAWQTGLLPVSTEAIEAAIELNAVAVPMNRNAFRWGRCMAADPAAVARLATPTQVISFPAVGHASDRRAPTGGNIADRGGDRNDGSRPDSGYGAKGAFAPNAPGAHDALDPLIERMSAHLQNYQGKALVERYRHLIDAVRQTEQQVTGGHALSLAVARGYAKLLAFKDEYEVARLYTEPTFRATLDAQFEPGYTLRFHLAPPVLGRRDPATGIARKTTFGPWMMTGFHVLARLRFLRGTRFDPFGATAERRMERALIAEYEATVTHLLTGLRAENVAQAAAIAAIPEEIRGFGHVKERAVAAARAKSARLLASYQAAA